MWLYSHFSYIYYVVSAELSAAQLGWQRGSSSLFLSLISLIPALCHERLPCCWRWSEDWRGFGERRGGSADAKILHVISCLTAFSCILHFPSKEPQKRERRSRLVFVLHSPTQREIFIRSFLRNREAERGEGRRVDGETDRRRGEYVSVYLSAHSWVTKHDERTSVCWQIMAILWSSSHH